MIIHVDESPAGAGKTEREIKSITSRKCKVLFITERIESFAELESRMRAVAARQATAPIIEKIGSGIGERLGSVSRQIEVLPERHSQNVHVIVIATHAAMLRSDFSEFDGWEIVVDEVPAFLDFEEKQTRFDEDFFQRFYSLEDVGEGWARVTATLMGSAVTPSDVRGDQSHTHLAVFHQRVLEASKPDSIRQVICNLPNWSEMSSKGVKWCWASAFSLLELKPFSRVTFLGNRFRTDIGAKISSLVSGEDIQWVPLSPPKPRPFCHRTVHINYFSADRLASRNLFESVEGQKMLKAIGKRLAIELPLREHIWSANSPTRREDEFAGKVQTSKEILLEGGLKAENHLSPRQAGTNRHKGISYAAIVYSAKASPNLVSLLKVLGINRSAWERSIEYETILQFVTRTSVRDEGSSAPVHLWVFDHKQAHYLKEYLDGLSHVTVSMGLVENGPVIPELERRGPKRKVRTPEEQIEYILERKRKDAERKRRVRALARQARKAA